jgi:hypothetical protein
MQGMPFQRQDARRQEGVGAPRQLSSSLSAALTQSSEIGYNSSVRTPGTHPFGACRLEGFYVFLNNYTSPKEALVP